jgi:hypothetical protein
MDPITPRLADILDPWLTAYAAERTGRRRDRLLAVGVRARACLEAEVDRIATTPELELLAHERDFGTPDAAARVIGADALPSLLLRLATEAWMPVDRVDRLAQLQVLNAMGQWMSSPRGPWWASYCDVLTLLVEVDRLRRRHRSVDH